MIEHATNSSLRGWTGDSARIEGRQRDNLDYGSSVSQIKTTGEQFGWSSGWRRCRRLENSRFTKVFPASPISHPTEVKLLPSDRVEVVQLPILSNRLRGQAGFLFHLYQIPPASFARAFPPALSFIAKSISFRLFAQSNYN